jgi:hypothetical protein
MRHYHEPAGSSETNDPATWDVASYQSHPVDFLEPVELEPNGYRQAALFHLRLMYACDEFITGTTGSRLAVVTVAVVLGWPSTRSLTIENIANQLGVRWRR